MPAYRISLGFSAKKKTLIFVWIFMCVDFHLSKGLQKLRTVPPEIVTSLVRL